MKRSNVAIEVCEPYATMFIIFVPCLFIRTLAENKSSVAAMYNCYDNAKAFETLLALLALRNILSC